MTERERVSPERLLEILNERLSEYDQCENCEIPKPPYRLREPREDGLNWSTQIQLNCSGRSTDACAEVLPAIVQEVASEYNVTVPDE